MLVSFLMEKIMKTKLQKTKAQVLQDYEFEIFKAEFGIGFTTNHTGKMEGMCSLSTSCMNNERCKKNAKIFGPDSACAYCYARARLSWQHATNEKYTQNGNVLSSKVIPVKNWCKINPKAYPVVRIESFGDVQNAIQAANYFRLAKANPKVTFTAWTKNLDLYEEANKIVKKPANFILIASSPMLNKKIDVNKHPIVDKTFTVYTYDYIKKNALHPEFINCGARSCLKCQKCYKANGEQNIREILKQDFHKVEKYWERWT